MKYEHAEHQPEEQVRLEKLRLLEGRTNPFPSTTARTHTTANLRAKWDVLVSSKKRVTIAGRIMTMRVHGGVTFMTIEDDAGRIQGFIRKDGLGEEAYVLCVNEVERGDIVELRGVCVVTQRGEKSVLADRVRILTKAVLPLPEKWHGITDTEIRYRKRYLDLLSNPDVRAIFKMRSNIISAIRTFLQKHHFLEVDTPILHTLAGGATARPFVTHHNTLDIDLFLRVAPELFLKRLIVGGFERVFEIAKCFRNEGMDYSHNPEFTQVEFYEAYSDYQKLMKFTEKLLVYILMQTHGTVEIPYEKHRLNFAPPYPRLTMREAIIRETEIDIDTVRDVRDLYKRAKVSGVDVTTTMHWAKIVDEIFKTLVRPKLIQPTFITDHPVELSPLAKKKESDPRYVERFQLICAGAFELCNAFSELNDPRDQEQRFREQQQYAKGGDEEAQPFDRDYVESLKHGLPPTAGFGMGIDRLTMLLTNQHSIKEVIFFPTMRPQD